MDVKNLLVLGRNIYRIHFTIFIILYLQNVNLKKKKNVCNLVSIFAKSILPLRAFSVSM